MGVVGSVLDHEAREVFIHVCLIRTVAHDRTPWQGPFAWGPFMQGRTEEEEEDHCEWQLEGKHGKTSAYISAVMLHCLPLYCHCLFQLKDPHYHAAIGQLSSDSLVFFLLICLRVAISYIGTIVYPFEKMTKLGYSYWIVIGFFYIIIIR